MKLLDCPFCGRTEADFHKFKRKTGFDFYEVIRCYCGGQCEGWTEEEAAKDWNSRVKNNCVYFSNKKFSEQELSELFFNIAKADWYDVYETDTYQWFKWTPGPRPINKYYLCNVVLSNGQVMFDQNPRDFDWDSNDVVAAQQTTEREI